MIYYVFLISTQCKKNLQKKKKLPDDSLSLSKGPVDSMRRDQKQFFLARQAYTFTLSLVSFCRVEKETQKILSRRICIAGKEPLM